MKPTTLVLLPGLDGTDIFFQPLLQTLPPDVRPRVLSYPASLPQDYASLLAWVRREIADVSHCHVLGWSFSGPLALMLAAAEPHKVRSVILVASFVRAPHVLVARMRFALVAPLIWSWRAVRRLPLLLRPDVDAWRRAKMLTWQRVSAHTLAARLRAIAAVDVRAELCALPQPLLYLASAQDGVVPHRNRDEILHLRPTTHMATIPGHHQSLYSHPQEATQVITDFLARTDAAFQGR